VSGIIPPDHDTPPQDALGAGTGKRGFPRARKATGDAELGRKLRKCRLEGGQGLKQPARFAGVAASTLSDYEVGRSGPSVIALKRLADCYGVSVDWLLKHLSGRDAAA
jgi:Helix-turn-helix domain